MVRLKSGYWYSCNHQQVSDGFGMLLHKNENHCLFGTALSHVMVITAGVPGFREVQQQASAVQEAQAQLWAERSQLAVEQQAVAEDKARAVQNVQEAAMAHSSLLLHLKQARAQSVLVITRLFFHHHIQFWARESTCCIFITFKIQNKPCKTTCLLQMSDPSWEHVWCI